MASEKQKDPAIVAQDRLGVTYEGDRQTDRQTDRCAQHMPRFTDAQRKMNAQTKICTAFI